jgi:hypothetical protein
MLEHIYRSFIMKHANVIVSRLLFDYSAEHEISGTVCCDCHVIIKFIVLCVLIIQVEVLLTLSVMY